MSPDVAKRLAEITVDPKSVMLAGSASGPSEASNGAGSKIGGKWSMVADAGGQVVQLAVEFAQTGDDFTGSTYSPLGNGTILGGKMAGTKFTAVLKADVQGNVVDFVIEGSLDGDKMSGTLNNAGFGSIPFTATRDK